MRTPFVNSPVAGTSAARELCVLGPTSFREHGVARSLRPREMDVLAALALHHPRPVSAHAIVELLWPEGSPKTAKEAVVNHIARLRRTLGDSALVTEAGTYRLGADWSIDVAQFDALVLRARRGALDHDHLIMRLSLRSALELIRGEAFMDLPESTVVAAERARRHHMRTAAEEEFALALLAGGEISEAIAEASAMTEAEPFREVRWAILALALYRDGQRRESVRELQRGHALLQDVSGLDWGPVMSRLESMILEDDPGLHSASPQSLVGQGGMDPTTFARGERVFVGRESLSDGIRQQLARVFDERSGFWVEICGDDGVGKTALAQRIAAQAAIDGWNVVSATCNPTRSRLLEPLDELVRQVIDQEPSPHDVFDESLLADLAVMRSGLPGVVSVGDLGAATVDAITGHASRCPLLVVVDDAQFLAASVVHLLSTMIEVSVPIVVLTCRRSGTPRTAESATVLELEGLELDEAVRLVETLSGTAVTRDVAAAAHAATSGNPRSLRRLLAGDDPSHGGKAYSSRSASERLLRSAITAMPTATHCAAVLLAVAGAPLEELVLLAAMRSADCPPEVTADFCATAVALGRASGVLRASGDGRLDLSSSELREALLTDLDPEVRVRFHAALGEALMRCAANAVAAAPHMLAAAALDPFNAIDVAEEAANLSSRATMFLEAAALLVAAVALAEMHYGLTHRRTLALLLNQAECLRRAGDPSNIELAWLVVKRAEENNDSQSYALGAAALCKLGPLTEAGRLNTDVAEVVQRALAGCHEPAALAICAGHATLFYSMSGHVEMCRSLFDIAMVNARLANDDAILIDTLGFVYASLSHPDDLPLRAELAAELLAMAEETDDDVARFEALHLYFSTQLQAGDPLLRTTFARQEALALRLRFAGRSWMAGYQRACIAHIEGRLDDALAIGAEIFEQAPVARSRALATYAMNDFAVKLAQGRGQELADEIDVIVSDQPGIPGWRAIAAWLAALRGDFQRVLHECDVLRCGAALPSDIAWSASAMLLGRAVATTGDPSRISMLTALLGPHTGLMTWYGSGTVGPIDQALAELALARGDHAAARTHAESAQRLVNRLKASVYQPDIDRLVAALGT